MLQKIEENKKYSSLFYIIKNYIFLFFGISYFLYYFSPEYIYLRENIKINLIYGNIILEYINATMAFLTFVGLIGVVNRILRTILRKIVNKTDNDIDNIMVNYLYRIIKTSKYFIAIFIFFQFISINKIIDSYINNSFYIIFLLIFLYYLTSFINITFEKILIKRTRFRSLNKHLLTFIKKIIIIGTWIIGIITVLSNLGYNVTALITGAGIGGLAIALAAQKTLSNVFGAITVLLTKPFRIGDFVKIGNQIGEIKEMGLSHLTMIDKEGYYVLIPNEKLISNNIENLSKRETRRFDFGIGIEYSSTLIKTKEAIKIIEDILKVHYDKKEINEDYRVNLENFGDFSLNIQVTYFSLKTEFFIDYVKQKEEINLEIKEKFAKAKINMAFPTQEIIMKKS